MKLEQKNVFYYEQAQVEVVSPLLTNLLTWEPTLSWMVVVKSPRGLLDN